MTTEYETAAKLLSPISSVQAAFAAAAVGNYAQNDVVFSSATVGAPIQFVNALRKTGGVGKLVGASLACGATSGLVVATFSLHLFSSAPTTSEMRDNVAFSLAAADNVQYLGQIDFPALVDVGAFSFKVSSVTPAAPLLVHSDTRDLYGILQITLAETNESAGMAMTITLYIE
jgi:hypothetical protein